MEKKHIFIAIHYLEIGGAETALIGLLDALYPEKVDVDLFLYDQRGEMMRYIPQWVNLLPPIPQYTMIERPIRELILKGFWNIAVGRLFAKLKSVIDYKKSRSIIENSSLIYYVEKYINPFLPKINPGVKYDLAISFLIPHRIVLNKVNAQKKIAWIHTDYSRIWTNPLLHEKVWAGYDYIASISDDVTKTFLQVFPSLSNKIVEMENILSAEFVRKRSEEFQVEFNENDNFPLNAKRSTLNVNYVNLLSVGRFCEAKNYDNVPDICKKIVSSFKFQDPNLNIRWYIIGFGVDEELIRRKIAEAGMQNHVIILGKKSYPYPYIKACDIYVQPSRYEGKSVTVREAQMLCKPVVVTNYPTAKSQIQDGIDGRIVPMDNEGCAEGLAEFILNTEMQEQVTEYLKTHDYGNEKVINKLYTLMD